MRRGARTALLLGVAWSLGCASTSPAGPRGELNALVTERMGVSDAISTEQDERAAAVVDRRIEQLLAGPLTLDGALELALLNNPGLAAQMESIGVAQAELVEAGLLDNPTIGGDLVVSTLGNGLGGGFSVGTSLLTAFLIPAKRKVAKANLQQTILDVGFAAAKLGEAVKIAYVHAQFAAADVELHRESLQAAEVLDALARSQRDAGNLTERERAEAGAHLDTARLEFGEARMASMMAREELIVLLGLWGPDVEFELPTTIAAPPDELPTFDTLIHKAIDERLDLSASRFDVEASKQAIKLRRAGVIPALEVGAEGRNEVGDDVGHEWVIGPSLAIELPIFDPGHADFAALRARLRASEHRLREKAVQVRSEVRIHQRHLVYAHQKAAYVETVVVPRHEMISARSLERYNAMLIGAEELFAVNDDRIAARREHLRALTDYWTAVFELEAAVGSRLPEAY